MWRERRHGPDHAGTPAETGNRAETLANQMLIFGRPVPIAETVAKILALQLL